MEKKKMDVLVIAAMVILVVISANMETVKSQGPGDCYDGCSTGCVSFFPDNRRIARCDRKCQIRCSPDREANGNLK